MDLKRTNVKTSQSSTVWSEMWALVTDLSDLDVLLLLLPCWLGAVKTEQVTVTLLLDGRSSYAARFPLQVPLQS